MTPERALEIVDELKGTAKSIHECLQDNEDQYDKTLTDLLDQEIFECECCGWWCEMSEMSNKADGSCDECEPDHDD